jgi:conjugative transfer signal peptidase TraF
VSRTSSAAEPLRPALLGRGLTVLAILAAALSVHLFRFALTPSLPRGIYLALPPSSQRPGDIVAFCPPESLGRNLLARKLVAPGHCPGGSVPLAKRISAVAPWVCTGRQGVWVDDRFLPWPALPASLHLPRFETCGPTPPDCVFVVGDSRDSIDSRSFGCVSASAVRDRLIPILTERRTA